MPLMSRERSQRNTNNRVAAFYRRIGVSGWQKSSYFTDTCKFPSLRSWMTAKLPVKTGTLISVGCGTGELDRAFAETCWVVSIDFSLEMLRRAARRRSGSLVQADAHALPFATESFDGALLSESIGHLEMGVALPEVARVLKCRSWLAVTSYARHRPVHPTYVKYDCEQISTNLARAGFHIEERCLLTPSRKKVQEVQAENDASLIFVLARKNR